MDDAIDRAIAIAIDGPSIDRMRRSTTSSIDRRASDRSRDRSNATRGASRQGATTTTPTMSHQDWKEITIGKRATSGTSGTSARAMKDPKAVAAVRERRERARDARMNECANE